MLPFCRYCNRLPSNLQFRPFILFLLQNTRCESEMYKKFCFDGSTGKIPEKTFLRGSLNCHILRTEGHRKLRLSKDSPKIFFSLLRKKHAEKCFDLNNFVELFLRLPGNSSDFVKYVWRFKLFFQSQSTMLLTCGLQ